MGTAALERALGDVSTLLKSAYPHPPPQVYVSVTGAAHCPLLLRDLLATREMGQALEHTAVSLVYVYNYQFISYPLKVFVLRCVMGPPTGLNLRNIAWHGFLSHTEIPPQ